MAKSLRTTHDLVTTNLREVIQNLQTGLVDVCMASAGLAIKAGGSALAKSVNTVYAFIGGAYVAKAAADMAALSGTVATATSNVFVFTVNAAGTLATHMGTAGATVGAVVFPAIPSGEVVLGFVMLTNASGSDFIGGTTALDAGSITTVYVNTPFPFNPNVVTL